MFGCVEFDILVGDVDRLEPKQKAHDERNVIAFFKFFFTSRDDGILVGVY